MAQVTNRIVNQVVTDTGNSEQQIEKLETSISTLDGAINLVGGSVEFLAGALVLSGAASEETAAQFESVALGAIAVADGANRALQGYKILKTETQLLDKAQKFLNTTVAANPYVAAAVAVGALAAAIGTYLAATSDAVVEQKRLNELNASANEIAAESVGELKILQSIVNDTSISEEKRADALDRLKELLPDLNDLDLNRKGALEGINTAIEEEIGLIQKRARTQAAEEKLTELYQQQLDVISQQPGFWKKIGNNIRAFLNPALTTATVEAIDNADALGEINEQIEFFTEILKEDYIPETEEATGKQEEFNKELEKTIALAPKTAAVVTEVAGAQLKTVEELTADTTETFDMRLRRLVAQQQQFFESETAAAIEASLNVASELLRVTSENIDDSTKEGFEKSKQFKIAETRIASIEAAFQAYKSVVGVPIVGQILAPLAAAAALATGQNAINNIKASTFQSTGNPSFDASTPSTGGGGGTAGGTGVPQIPGFGTSGVTTLNAVVLAGDVTSAQAQDAAIRNRRRFGRGG